MELRPFIRELGSVFGEVLHVQEGGFYNSSHVIRAVVLYDLDTPIVKEVAYIIGGRQYKIKVDFLDTPNRCNKCKEFDHLVRKFPNIRALKGWILRR